MRRLWVGLELLALVAAVWTLRSHGAPVANFPLVDQNGKPFQLHDYKGNYLLLSFIYSRCPMPKMCPLTVSLNREVYERWKKRPGAPPLKFLLTTLDPEHDTPSVLKDYAKQRKLDPAAFRLATGSPQVLAQFASTFGVLGKPAAGGFISHNL